MATETTQAEASDPSVGATPNDAWAWHATNWRHAERNVRRLQARITQATQQGKWGKVKALQRLLTHSFSGKALAVRRVTENQGKNTPGVDKVRWDTPQKKLNAIYALRQRDYHPKPLKRVYIPKKNGKKRPLGMPICLSYCLSFQAMFGIPIVANGVDQNLQPTLILLLYHVLPLLTSTATFPVSLNRLAQLRDDVWGEGNPTRAMRVRAHALQNPCVTPIGNRRNVDIEQFRSCQCGVAPIASLSGRTEARSLRASKGNVGSRTNPVDFAGRKAAAQPRTQPLLIEQVRDLGSRVGRSQLLDAADDLRTGLTDFPRLFEARNGQARACLRLPANVDANDVAALGERHIFDQ